MLEATTALALSARWASSPGGRRYRSLGPVAPVCFWLCTLVRTTSSVVSQPVSWLLRHCNEAVADVAVHFLLVCSKARCTSSSENRGWIASSGSPHNGRRSKVDCFDKMLFAMTWWWVMTSWREPSLCVCPSFLPVIARFIAPWRSIIGLPRRLSPRRDEISTMNVVASVAWRSSTLILLTPQGNRLPRWATPSSQWRKIHESNCLTLLSDWMLFPASLRETPWRSNWFPNFKAFHISNYETTVCVHAG